MSGSTMEVLLAFVERHLDFSGFVLIVLCLTIVASAQAIGTGLRRR